MKIGIFGRGRLGSVIAAQAGVDLNWCIRKGEEPGGKVDVVIDASHPDAVAAHVRYALDHSTPLVIGTTGWTMPDLKERVGNKIGVLVAPNFSLTVALMARLAVVLGRFSALDDRRDLYIAEHHHAGKIDAPSGTARMLAELMMKACPRKTSWKVGAPVTRDQLSISVQRAGSTYSSHTIGLDDPSEFLEIRHTARSAAVYAQGALAASQWILSRKGLYTFADMAAPMVDSLFQSKLEAR